MASKCFTIQCTSCCENFASDTEYDKHSCPQADDLALRPLHIKIESLDEDLSPENVHDDTEPSTEDSPELEDIKPVLSSTGEVIKDFAQTLKQKQGSESQAGKVTCSNEIHVKNELSVEPTKKKKRLKIKNSLFVQKSSPESTSNESSKSTEDDSLRITVKSEPLDSTNIGEIVNVKDEPMELEDMTTDAQDPLSNSVQDILGLEDEDYLIENFVEYDEELAFCSPDTDFANEESGSEASSPITTEKLHSESQKGSNDETTSPTLTSGHACKQCKKKFYEKEMLEAHIRLAHRTPRPYACNICHKRFTHKNYVNLHMRVHTGEKPYQCMLCSRRYSHKTSFTIHMRIHKGDRPYECTVCGKKCYDKSGLTSHMRSHTKETPYQCECCGRRFTHSKSLLVHRRNHTGEKPYICPHCGRAFRHWHKHKIHIRLHTGERPYKCKICNKGFPRNDEVKRHMRSHTGIKTFRCSICGVYCATQASITGHINLHHVTLKEKQMQPERTIVESGQAGILGKKPLYKQGMYRTIDNTSYDEYLCMKPKWANEKKEIVGKEEGSGPQIIVTPRPMTPQEKVTNKSMTYKQFLTEQEQQLLAKGLKVVNKKNNTYGLAMVHPPDKVPLSSDSKTGKNTETKTLVKKEAEDIDDAFVKIPNVRKNNHSAKFKPPQSTRIILPNMVNGDKKALVVSEEATKLILGNKTQIPDQQENTDTNFKKPVIIQTVGKTMSPPMFFQQPFVSDPQVNSTTINQSNSFNLHNTVTLQKPETENIIVLNQGVSGGSPTKPVTPASTAPFLVVSQPIMQQQLLLLPGINGGPARLVLLQPNPATAPVPVQNTEVKDTPPANDAAEASVPPPATIISPAPGQVGTFLVLKPKITPSTTTVTVKEEPKDVDEASIKKEVEDTTEEAILPLTPASTPKIFRPMVKIEPAN